MVCLIHGEDCFLSGGGASFFVGRVKLLLLRGGAGGCVAFEPDDVPVSFVSLVVPSPELASSMASRGAFGLCCSLSVGACFLAGGGAVVAAAATAASVSSAGGDYSGGTFGHDVLPRVGRAAVIVHRHHGVWRASGHWILQRFQGLELVVVGEGGLLLVQVCVIGR